MKRYLWSFSTTAVTLIFAAEILFFAAVRDSRVIRVFIAGHIVLAALFLLLN